jgi:uncharacterized protein YaaR (DUF327 family)
MSSEFKLDINIPQKKIEEMAKQVIREIVEEKIQEAINDIDVTKIIENKLKTIDTKLSQITKDVMKKQIDSLIWTVRGEVNQTVRNIVLEEVQKKPLSGNVYLKIDGSNVETDYDY